MEYVKDAELRLKYRQSITGSVIMIIKCVATARIIVIVQVITKQGTDR